MWVSKYSDGRSRWQVGVVSKAETNLSGLCRLQHLFVLLSTFMRRFNFDPESLSSSESCLPWAIGAQQDLDLRHQGSIAPHAVLYDQEQPASTTPVTVKVIGQESQLRHSAPLSVAEETAPL
jgi:hypothetical protein